MSAPVWDITPNVAAGIARLRTNAAEADRLEREAAWLERAAVHSQHTADNLWYCGRLKLAGQFDRQAERERELARWLAAEAALRRS